MGRIDEALRRSGASAPANGATPFHEEVTWSSPDSPDRAVDTPLTVEPESFRAAGAAPLGDPAAVRPELLAVSDGADPALGAGFRRMVATLYAAQEQANLKVVLVTSSVPGEGKTLTAINLALILSRSFRCRVLLVDADMREPSIHEAWGVAREPGLADAMETGSAHNPSFLQVNDHLDVLPAGQLHSDPIGALTSEQMRRVLAEARARYDWVVLDSPPVAAVDDAGLLASLADAVLFVVRAGSTNATLVQRSVNEIGRERIFGVALNGSAAGDLKAYGRYGYGYG